MNYLMIQRIQIVNLNVIASSLVQLEILIQVAEVSHLFYVTFDFITEQTLFEVKINSPDLKHKNDSTVLSGLELLYKNHPVILYIIKPLHELYISGRFN